jgi:hypothetical protein
VEDIAVAVEQDKLVLGENQPVQDILVVLGGMVAVLGS